ncbi:DUF3943 domain-containing protein [Thioalkalivibrio sp. XN279]|uniref:DUF3943 domain-containing protein n=1 Tax=Thioalkalivibrio sp. XN279 TaxID=2714953 RepID=UPI00197F8953
MLGCLPAAALAAMSSPAPGSALGTATATATAPEGPDRAGLRRDTSFLLSYQVGTVVVLYTLPESVTNWTEEQRSDYSLDSWWQNVRNPQWDSDDFYLNYVLHPYWGAAYYVRARERGYDERASLWYSFAMSSAFEFGVEALFEEPSIQDIIVTPVAGAILGEYFMGVRARTQALYEPGEPMEFRHRALLALSDPIGAINRQVESWLGIEEGNASFRPYMTTGPRRHASRFDGDIGPDETIYGLRLYYRW